MDSILQLTVFLTSHRQLRRHEQSIQNLFPEWRTRANLTVAVAALPGQVTGGNQLHRCGLPQVRRTTKEHFDATQMAPLDVLRLSRCDDGLVFSARKSFGWKAPQADNISGFGASGNVYEELGVTTVINGQGTMTTLGGSLIRPEVEA